MTSNDATGAAGAHVHEDIRVARPAEGVLLLTIDRPAVRNALRTRTLAEIAGELAAAADDPATGAVVVTGGPDSFAAGADLTFLAFNEVGVGLAEHVWEALEKRTGTKGVAW